MFLAMGAAVYPLVTAFVIFDTRTLKFHSPLILEESTSKKAILFSQMTEINDNNNDSDPMEDETAGPQSAPNYPRKEIGISKDQESTSSESYDVLFQKPDHDPFQADFRDSSEPKLMTTLAGGTSLMFEMIAKRMLNWGNEARPFSSTEEMVPPSTETRKGQNSLAEANSQVLPRWHPHNGISDANPNFRNQAPVMNNQGKAINVKK